MKVLFWGTPAYAVPSLDALVAAGHRVVGVVSQPDRRRGRGAALVPSPVKARALELGLPVFTPQRIRRDLEVQAELAALGADLSVVVAFGQILPPAVLQQPPLGCWNGHGSLLPRWRGAGPIQWCLLEGDSETGVGIMAMEEGLDTGPVLLERRIPIGLLENAHALAARLSQLTAELLVEALPRIEAAGPGPEAERLARLGVRPQPSEGITLARMLTKDDHRLHWQDSALALHRRVMALYPGAFTHWQGKRLKVLASEPLVHRLIDQLSPEAQELCRRWAADGGSGRARDAAPPGSVLAVENGVGMLVSTGGCPLLLRAGQLEGKAAATGQSLLQQLGAVAGDRLGEASEWDAGVA
ncbi:MAG: methionyl-tRNA formyltransferase [Synechococcus sp.]|nr:methionyl-tRNA formyltransferase [Synechococcus sp.]